MRTSSGHVPAYNVQTAVDAEHALIVAQLVTTEANDERSLLPMAEAAKQALGAPALLNVVADAEYSNGEQAECCESQGIVPHVQAHRAVNNQGDGTLFDRSQFQYDATTDSFRCPAGQRLVRKQLARKDRAVIYAGHAEECGNCPLKTRCTTSAQRFLRDICMITLCNACSCAPHPGLCACDDPRLSIRSPRSNTASSDTHVSCCVEEMALRLKSAWRPSSTNLKRMMNLLGAKQLATALCC